jgi:hypothetical protein
VTRIDAECVRSGKAKRGGFERARVTALFDHSGFREFGISGNGLKI